MADSQAFAPDVMNSPALIRDAQEIPVEQRFVVATKGGLWPSIGLLPDNSLMAMGFNAPGHTNLPGDTGVWRSTNGGRNWNQHSQITRPASNTNWCDACWGLTRKGRIVYLTGGYADPADANKRRHPLETGAYYSDDMGKTWKRSQFPAAFPKGELTRPYGRIVTGHDGYLYTVTYAVYNGDSLGAYLMRSKDNGLNWETLSWIDQGINEGALLPLKTKGHWLLSIRTVDRPAPEYGQELKQYRSIDNGVTWRYEGVTTGYNCHPSSLIALKNGQLLQTYGNRRDYRIEAMMSADEGKTWSEPFILAKAKPGDMGYPSSVQRKDGLMVTVFYAQKTELCDEYHMAGCIWKVPDGMYNTSIVW